MTFEQFNQVDKNYIRANLRRLNIKYPKVESKFKKSTSRTTTYMMADIKVEHLKKAVDIIEKSDHKQSNGYCRFILDRAIVQRLNKYIKLMEE